MQPASPFEFTLLHSFAKHPRKALLPFMIASVVAGTTLHTNFAMAQTSALTHANLLNANLEKNFAIPAGSLDQVLNQFALDAGLEFSSDAALTNGKTSMGLQGSYSVQQGLQKILVGTGLQYRVNNGMVNLVAASTAKLSTVKVSADSIQESAYGSVVGYVAKRSATGTKTDTPLIETPQSITVIGADQIETLRAQSISDAIAYSVGAFKAPYTERTSDEVMLRGFSIPATFRDGARYQTNRFDGQQELYGLERIEVLKGASSILYGAAEPGGVVNTVSKRPTTESLRELNVELGSFNRKQIAADIGGALTQDGEWSYRLTGVERDSDAYTDNVANDRTYIAPALKWQPSVATSFTLLSDYQRDHTTYSGDGLPLSGTALPNKNGQIPRNRFTGEPGYDRYDIERYAIGYLLEHAFSDDLKLRHSLRNYRMNQDWSAVSISLDLDADERTTLGRYAEDRIERNSLLSSDTSFQYDWQAEGITHKTLVGMDITETEVATGRYSRAIGMLDIYSPVYGGGVGAPTPDYGWRSDTKQLGLYLQDQLKIADKWVVLLGGRHDRVQQTQCDYFNLSNCYIDNEKSSASTGRIGTVYLADNGVAPFISFSQSFEPTTGVGRNSDRFKPTKGEQVEAGVRYQPAGTDLLLSAATYQLTQSNLLTEDPTNNGYQLQQGEVRSRGIELEAKGQASRNLQIIGAYTYTDARTTKASPLYPESEGKRTSGIPYDQLSLWGDYSLDGFSLPEVKIGAGARYVGETGSQWHSVKAPAYTVFDLMASYTNGPLRLALNITNLTDKTYLSSCPYRCFYGEPQKAVGSASYRW